MIRLVCLLKRADGLEAEAFQAGLLDRVGPVVAGMQARLGICRHVQFHADASLAEADRAAAQLRSSPSSPFAAMLDLWWPTAGALQSLLESADGQEAISELKDALAGLVASGESECWLANEYPQVSTGPARVVARRRTSIVKLVFPLMPLPELGEAAARDYWLTRHGPLVRSHAPARGMVCYQQVHRRTSELTGRIAAGLDMAEGSYMGHAEAWWDRALARGGAEMEDARTQAAADERNFVDLTRSFLFSGKEYLFVERDWVI
jgi:hypothetical protein